MKRMLLAALATVLSSPLAAQDARTGPAVTGFGEFYPIPEAVELADASNGVRAVFDIKVGSEDPGQQTIFLRSSSRQQGGAHDEANRHATSRRERNGDSRLVPTNNR